MIESAQIGLHQNAAFLAKSDLLQHNVMQSILRQVAREFAMADTVAANRLATQPNSATNADVRQGVAVNLSSIEALTLTHQLHYPMVLKRAVTMFGLDARLHDSDADLPESEIGREQDQDEAKHSEDDADSEEAAGESGAESAQAHPANTDQVDAVDLVELSVFRAVDQLIPELQDQGLCAGLLVSFYRCPAHINGMWKHRHMVVVLPISGELGRQRAAFTYLLRRGFEPIAIQGKISMHPGNPIQPWPSQALFHTTHDELVKPAQLTLEGVELVGKSFLMGLITSVPPRQHWLNFDHRDIS